MVLCWLSTFFSELFWGNDARIGLLQMHKLSFRPCLKVSIYIQILTTCVVTIWIVIFNTAKYLETLSKIVVTAYYDSEAFFQPLLYTAWKGMVDIWNPYQFDMLKNKSWFLNSITQTIFKTCTRRVSELLEESTQPFRAQEEWEHLHIILTLQE